MTISPRPKSEGEIGVNAYFLCGLKVSSELDFPELAAWRGAPSHPADIEFSIGPVVPLEDPDHAEERFQAKGDSQFILNIYGVGRVLVADGQRIVFDPLEGADPTRVRLNLIGTVQSILWHQRGLLPLHASAVRIDGKALAIAGQTGGGKSVLAAVLTQGGLPLLSDDFTVLSVAQAPPMLLPGYQRVRLWDDACEALGLQDKKLAPAHPVYAKFVVETQGPTEQAAAPLSDILVMTGKREGDFALERLGVAPAIQALLGVVHTPEAARVLGRQGQVFHAINALITGGVRIWRLSMPNDLARVQAAADAIVAATRP